MTISSSLFYLKHSLRISISLILVLTISNISKSQASCVGICNVGSTPCYIINFATNESRILKVISGLGHCCSSLSSNLNCAQVDLGYPANTKGFIIDVDEITCDIMDLYFTLTNDCGSLDGSSLLCDSFCPDVSGIISPGGGIISLLICKPGPFSDIDMDFELIPKPELCVDTLYVNEVPIEPSTYRASQVLHVTGEIANTPFETIFKAGQSICLDTSFLVNKGAKLEIIIDDCKSED